MHPETKGTAQGFGANGSGHYRYALYGLNAIVLLSTLAMSVWQGRNYQTILERMDRYHLETQNNLASVNSEFGLIKDILEQTAFGPPGLGDREIPLIIALPQVSPAMHIAENAVLRIAASQQAHGSPKFEGLSESLLTRFARLKHNISESRIHSTDVSKIEVQIDALRLTLEQLKRLHAMEYGKYIHDLPKEYRKSLQATLLGIMALLAISILLTKRILKSKDQAEKERAELEEQLRRSQRLEVIGTLAGGIAHDFNNILTPIIGYSGMALSDLKNTDQLRDDLEVINRSAKRAKNLVEQILLFGKPSGDRQQAVDLAPILEEALKLLRPVIPASIQIEKRIPLNGAHAIADPHQVHQVIVNLCTNACQAMEPDGGTITLQLERLDPESTGYDQREHGWIRLSVADEGVGMGNDAKEQVFDPFYTTKEVKKGTGLGLSVVHGIVKSHRGHIEIESEPGKGTRISIFLPAANQETPPAPNRRIERTTPGEARILLIDDDADAANTIDRMLAKARFQTTVCSDPRQAIDEFKEHSANYDLLITDLTMPQVDGVDLCRQIHKIRPDLPMILISGYGANLDQKALTQQGVRQVLAKPVEFEALIDAVSHSIHER